MRFVLILSLSIGAHVGFACWWMAPAMQEPTLLLQYGKVSVELMPVPTSAPSVAKKTLRIEKEKPKKASFEKPAEIPKKPSKKTAIRQKKPKAKPVVKTRTQKPKRSQKKESAQEKPKPKQPPRKIETLDPPIKINPAPKKQYLSKSNPNTAPSQPKSVGVTTAARLAANQRLTYPYEAQRRGIQGRVVLRLRISKTGKVLDAKLVASSGSRILDAAAREAAYRLRFLPARRNDENVESTLEQGFNYRLR